MSRFRTFFILSFFLALAVPARAEIHWGLRAGLTSEDTDPVIGAEALIPFGSSSILFNPNIEQSFGDRDVSALSADFVYRTELPPRKQVWGGIGVAQIIEEGSDLEIGANLFAGVGHGPRYVQVKNRISDRSRVTFVFGYRF